MEEREFGNGQLRSADSLAAIRDFLHRQPETSAGEFILPLVPVALRAGRRPLASVNAKRKTPLVPY